MTIRLRHYWEELTTGYWFIPAVMMTVATLAAFVLLWVDRTMIGSDSRVEWLYAGGSEGAKTLLSTVASSVITVAGVVFSITIASLTQAASQFGPRLLRNFMRDRGNQIVLGTFVATFVYCLLVLRAIHGKLEDGKAFVPQASVTGAVALAVASTAVLIYFIHHVSVQLQAPSVVAAVREDLDGVIAGLRQTQSGASVPLARGDGSSGPKPPERTTEIRCDCDGYIQAVDYESVMNCAAKWDTIVRLQCRPGDYVVTDCTLGHIDSTGPGVVSIAQAVRRAFIVGAHGTPEQDVEYGVRQIVEVAVRALSPGVNDPFTAINCIDALGSVLCQVSRTGLPGPYRYDRDGNLRLVVPVTTFEGLVDMAFNQIRQNARDSVAVLARLLEVITLCSHQVSDKQRRTVLRRHAEMVFRASQSPQIVPEEHDRFDLRGRWITASALLNGHAAGASSPADAMSAG